ncbi:MAG: hypothetical protein J5730_04265 [Bacteroidales bacterium]|nr:hypothetical protein [Bacteroidales bacterium]
MIDCTFSKISDIVFHFKMGGKNTKKIKPMHTTPKMILQNLKPIPSIARVFFPKQSIFSPKQTLEDALNHPSASSKKLNRTKKAILSF